MGLFSFGKKEEPKGPLAEGRPEPITGRALMQTFATDDLDYLLQAYAPRAFSWLKGIMGHTDALVDGVLHCYDTHEKILSKLDAISSRLDDITRRLDALEQSKEIAERTR